MFSRVTTSHRDPLPDGSQLAAIDLGSNSFHLIIARIEHGEMRPVEALAEKVQLGAGLVNGRLTPEAIERGLHCLSRFAQLLESIEPERIRVVGTNALRQAKNRRDFTEPAQDILRCPVEVVYGAEEARLVYLGVAHSLADDAQSRLVIDIGGGSTEFIIGQRFEPQRLESLQLGCVSYSGQHFPDNRLSAAAFDQAYDHAATEVSHIRKSYDAEHWEECVGSSGTLNAIAGILGSNGWSDGAITRKGLSKLKKHLLQFEDFESVELNGLAEGRRNVIAAGAAITLALFDTLHLEQMRTSKGALREGVVYDLLGRLSHEDVRERTVNALVQRYGADGDNAIIVSKRAEVLFDATRDTWGLSQHAWELLHWTALSHEIGMTISHKHYNRHSAYLLRNSDLPGFSQDEQEELAILAASHRGKLNDVVFSEVSRKAMPRLSRLVTIMRLAAVFKYVEQLEQLPDLTLSAQEDTLSLDLPEGWLAMHPLTSWELGQEKTQLAKLGIKLVYN